MKKWLSVSLVCLIILSITVSSCKKADKTDYGYIFAEINETIMKIDVNTGVATPLCSDALCKHDSKTCPFFSCSINNNRFVATENNDMMYFIADDLDPQKYYIRSYSLKSAEIKQFYETGNEIRSIFLLNEFLLFTETILTTDSNNKTDAKTDIYRFNIKTNNIEKLNSEPIESVHYPAYIDGDRLYWRISLTNKFYSTTFDYKDRNDDIPESKKIRYENSDWMIKFEDEDNDHIPETMYKINEKTNEKVLINKNISTYKVFDDILLYTVSREDKLLIGTDAENEHKYYSYIENKIYSVKLDGIDNKVLCDFENNYLQTFIYYDNYDPSYGDFRLASFIDYIFTSDGKISSVDMDKYAVFNIKTGEYKFVTH